MPRPVLFDDADDEASPRRTARTPAGVDVGPATAVVSAWRAGAPAPPHVGRAGSARGPDPAVRARRRLVRVAAQPTRAAPARPSRWRSSPGGAPRRPATRSQDAGVIGSSLAFQLWSKVSGGATFQAGTYELTTNMGVRDALDAARTRPRRGIGERLHVAAPARASRCSRSPIVWASCPGTTARRSSSSRRSGAVRSKYQPVDQPSVEGLTWPDTYFVGEHADRHRHPAHHRRRVRQARRRGQPRERAGHHRRHAHAVSGGRRARR